MKQRDCLQATREDQLRAAFQAAAASEGRSAARVLRDLMGGYVEMQRNAAGAKATRAYGLERCTAALAVCPEPWKAAKLLTDEQRELHAMVKRQHGWRTDSFRAGPGEDQADDR